MPEKNNIVTKSNSLIEANYKTKLSLREQKIILYIVSKVEKDDEDFKTYTLPIKDFSQMMGLEGSPKYSELRKITEDLMSKVIEVVKKKESKVLQVHWMSSVEYNSEKGTIDFTFDPKLKPYLLQLQKEFTSYKLQNVLALNSGYSIRFYELLKKWEKIKSVEYTLEELRKRIGTGLKYKEYSNFKLRIITPSQKELANKTDIKFSYEEIKKGRKVESLRFIISTNKKEKETSNITEDIDELLFEELNELAEDYSISKESYYRWVKLGKSIWGKQYSNQLKTLIRYINNQDNKNNPIGLAFYILQEKMKLVEQGKDSSIRFKEKGTKEILPDWWNDYKDKTLTSTGYSEEEQQDKNEIETLLQKYKRSKY